MKRRLVFAVFAAFLALALVAVAGCSSPSSSGGSGDGGSSNGGSSAGGTEVTMESFAFNPQSIDVKVGDTVKWTNKDSANHDVTGDGGLDSGMLSNGQTYSKTFDTSGTFAYKCTIHPNMTGTVVVK